MPSLSFSRISGVTKFPWRMSILYGVNKGTVLHEASSMESKISLVRIIVISLSLKSKSRRMIPQAAMSNRVLKNVASDGRTRRERAKKRSLLVVYRFAPPHFEPLSNCLLYTSDAADE